MPTKSLPSCPNIDQLKNQAKDLQKHHAVAAIDALQRIREFHPRFAGMSDEKIRTAEFTLSDAQLTIAREYGFASWPRLRRISSAGASELGLPHHERIRDSVFRRAVDLVDEGDIDALRNLLTTHPRVIRQRVLFEGGNYFREPALLEFIAENPIRRGRLPTNIVDVARVLLDAGARQEQRSIDSTLGLVSSGRVPRECGAQIALIDLLCDYGANPKDAMRSALAHGEWQAVDALMTRGADLDLAVAAATGRLEEARRELPRADAALRHRALAWAAQYGHAEIVRILLDAGEDPNRYNPEGAHSHSTPMHQAALAGHADVVRLLVERGGRLDIRDILYEGTPLDWAAHVGRSDIVAYLQRQLPSRSS